MNYLYYKAEIKLEGKDGDRVPQNTEKHKETALTRERKYSSSYFTNKAGCICRAYFRELSGEHYVRHILGNNLYLLSFFRNMTLGTISNPY